MILDLGLPDMEGTQVIAGLRGWTTAPIIVLTGRTEQIQKIAALDAGADDYVTKPFGIEELFARMRAVSRRVTAQTQPSARLGEWVVDLAAHRVRPASGDGDDQKLTPTEWRILEILVRNPGRLITKQHLLHEVWGPGYDTETNYLRLYLAQLRRKLEPDPGPPGVPPDGDGDGLPVPARRRRCPTDRQGAAPGGRRLERPTGRCCSSAAVVGRRGGRGRRRRRAIVGADDRGRRACWWARYRSATSTGSSGRGRRAGGR